MSTRGTAGDPSNRLSRVMSSCAEMTGAEMTQPFGPCAAVFKVANRMFAVVGLDDERPRVTLKCDPDYATLLTQQFDDIAPGYHINKRHWITVTLNPSMSSDLIDQLIGDSYDLIVASLPVRQRRECDQPGR